MWQTESTCNPTRTFTPDAVTTYDYDYDNRLTTVNLPTNNDTVEYTYDATGRRLTKEYIYHNGANTDVTTYKYHYIGSQITEIEINAIRNPGESQTTLRDEEIKIHLGANSQPISYEWVKHISGNTTSATYYYHYDIHGNVLKVTDSSENTKITYTYDVLGKILTESNPDSVLNFFTFRGASQTIWEPETNLYYSGGYYRPDTGTALQGTGAPVLTNPASGAIINAMAEATAANAQLAAHAALSASSADSSGGAGGSFAPSPGPSDGLSHAGRQRSLPDPTSPRLAQSNIISNGGNGSSYNLISAGHAFCEFGGVKYVGPNDLPKPEPPDRFRPKPGDMVDDGGSSDNGFGKTWDPVAEAMSLYILLLAHLLDIDPRVICQMYLDGLDLGTIDPMNPNAKKFWAAWGEVDGKLFLFGYQVGDNCPRLFWGPRAGEDADPEAVASGRSPGGLYTSGPGLKFINSWKTPGYKEEIKIQVKNTTGCSIGIVVFGYLHSIMGDNTGEPVARDLLWIRIKAGGSVSMGYIKSEGMGDDWVLGGNFLSGRTFNLGDCIVVKRHSCGDLTITGYDMFDAKKTRYERSDGAFGWVYKGTFRGSLISRSAYSSWDEFANPENSVRTILEGLVP